MGIKCTDLKKEFLLTTFAAFRITRMREKAADRHLLVRMIREIEVSGVWFQAPLISVRSLIIRYVNAFYGDTSPFLNSLKDTDKGKRQSIFLPY